MVMGTQQYKRLRWLIFTLCVFHAIKEKLGTLPTCIGPLGRPLGGTDEGPWEYPLPLGKSSRFWELKQGKEPTCVEMCIRVFFRTGEKWEPSGSSKREDINSQGDRSHRDSRQ